MSCLGCYQMEVPDEFEFLQGVCHHDEYHNVPMRVLVDGCCGCGCCQSNSVRCLTTVEKMNP
jgi:hypothetical protein